MTGTSSSRLLGRDDGESPYSIEYSLLATVLVLFLSVSIDFARAFVQHSAISRIVYETARYAAAHPQPDNTPCANQILAFCSSAWGESVLGRMQTLVNDYLVEHPEFSPTDPTITKTIIWDSVAKRITIQLNFPFYPITPGFFFLSGTSETVIGPSLFY
jgi:hypothetical protein